MLFMHKIKFGRILVGQDDGEPILCALTY